MRLLFYFMMGFISSAARGEVSQQPEAEVVLADRIIRLADEGYKAVRTRVVEELSSSEAITFSVFLEVSDYTALAVCNKNCGRVQVSIPDVKLGSPAAPFDEQNSILLELRPTRSGYYKGKLTAPDCREELCSVGFTILIREASARQVADEKQLPPAAQPSQPSVSFAPAVPGTVPPAFDTFENLDLSGTDIASIPHAKLEICSSLCEASNTCKAYSFDRWNGWCFLKSEVSSLAINARSLSGVKYGYTIPPRSSTPITMERFRNKAFPGTGKSQSNEATLDDCENKCLKDDYCVAYSYFGQVKSCQLYQSSDQYTTNTTAHSGSKIQAIRP